MVAMATSHILLRFYFIAFMPTAPAPLQNKLLYMNVCKILKPTLSLYMLNHKISMVSLFQIIQKENQNQNSWEKFIPNKQKHYTASTRCIPLTEFQEFPAPLS